MVGSSSGIRSFLGYAGFYHRFIKDISKIAKPLAQLITKDAPFVFADECYEGFCRIKQILILPSLFSPLFGIFRLISYTMLAIML